MPTFDEVETSVQAGAPSELYVFELASEETLLTSAPEDVEFDGDTYTAVPISRGPISLVQIGKVRTLTVSLACDHSIAMALLNNGIPPRDTTLTLLTTHPEVTTAKQLFRGPIVQIEIDGSLARLTIAHALDNALDVRLPVARVLPSCRHMLYDRGCRVDRDYLVYETQGHLVACDVVSASGTELVVSNMNSSGGPPHPNQWAQFGEVRRLSDGERRSILSHEGTTLILDVPFGNIMPGDALEVWQGCDHTPETCRDTFDNMVNFGGFTSVPRHNPSSPTGIGVLWR